MGCEPASRAGLAQGSSMAWWIALTVVGIAGFLFDAEIARHIPFSDLTVRQTMIGTLLGLVAGFTIHVFERSRF
jgi:hypothetical protein